MRAPTRLDELLDSPDVVTDTPPLLARSRAPEDDRQFPRVDIGSGMVRLVLELCSDSDLAGLFHDGKID